MDIYMHIYTCTCVYIYTNAHTYTRIYIYILFYVQILLDKCNCFPKLFVLFYLSLQDTTIF